MRKSNVKACWLAIGLCVVVEGLGAETNGPCRYLPLTSGTVPDPGAGSLIFYASDYHQHEIYASPDVPSMIAFGFNSRLPKDKPQPQIRLVFDLPAGFQVYGGRFVGKPIESKDMEIEGKQYTRFTIKAPTMMRPGATELIVSTTIKAPRDFTAYYATEIDGQLCHRRTIPLHIISIPKVGAPKRIMTWFWPLHSVLDDYPDPDGFNKVGFAYPNAEYFKRVIKSGAFTKAEVSFLRFVVGGEGFAKDPDAVNVTLWGDKDEGPIACPTYRGKNFLGLIEKGKRAIDLGVYEHIFDPERENGQKVCFCPRCLARFKEWFTANSSLPYKEPREFMRNWRKFPDYCPLWVKFKVAQESERYSDYRREMLRYLREKGLAQDRFKLIFAASYYPSLGKPEANIESSFEDPLLLKEIVDYYCPMIYIEFMSSGGRADLLIIAERLKSLRQYTNGQLAVYPILSVGYPYFRNNIEPNGMMKYQVLEAFAGGAKGIFMYSEGWFDALDMKYFAEAMKAILPVEEIIAAGRPIEDEKVKDLNAATFVKGVASPAGAVILVSEYSTLPKAAKVEYRPASAAEVIDLADGQVIAKVSPSQPWFNVTLKEERARLFFVGQPKTLSK